MTIQEDFHKLASDIDLTPTQADAVLDFVIKSMVIVAKTNIPEEEIVSQAARDIKI